MGVGVLIRLCDVFAYFRKIRVVILFLESYDEGMKEMQKKAKSEGKRKWT